MIPDLSQSQAAITTRGVVSLEPCAHKGNPGHARFCRDCGARLAGGDVIAPKVRGWGGPPPDLGDYVRADFSSAFNDE